MSLELKEIMILRAQMLYAIRAFMRGNNIMEVETALFAHAPGTDVNLDPISIHVNNKQLWAQTSPEFAMKRLLANGCGDIYQITKAIRKGEIGKKHHFEFQMLEYYRVNFKMDDLIEDVINLLGNIIPLNNITKLTYGQLFEHFLGICPYTCSKENLDLLLKNNNCPVSQTNAEALDILYSFVIEPQLNNTYVITHYPADAAMLAKLDKDNRALRFEIVHNGVELANGFEELADSQLMRHRMNKDNTIRAKIGKETLPFDEAFLADLDSLPECSGVAFGLDRILMLKTGIKNIEQVRPFINLTR